MGGLFVIPKGLSKPSVSVSESIEAFLQQFETREGKCGSPIVLQFDQKSGAHYFCCHLDANTLAANCDLEASLDANDDDDLYKLNRDISEDQAAFKTMQDDACKGRSFEDMVTEFDSSYRPEKPLKVYGGQHRIRAISKAAATMGTVVHGVRVYFSLSREQKVEIATVNNTSIAVPNDLLDRMREQLLGSELRDWCQTVGLLGSGEDFSDRRSPEPPTVRVARTLVVNFCLGKAAKDSDFQRPLICKSGGLDDTYLKMRESIDWKKQELITMGKEFSRLHKAQRERVSGRDKDTSAEFARKAISLAVAASWAYAAGLFQKSADLLKYHYGLPDSATPPEDPLNAKALSQARLKGTDPDTYRGLGTRSSPGELGRMLEVFLVLATKATKKRITKDLANAAIQSYEAKRATNEANKVLGKI